VKAPQLALEHIRAAINLADALRMRSSAVLVADLKVLLKIAESADRQTGVSVARPTASESESNL
jgi:hypothetical protein